MPRSSNSYIHFNGTPVTKGSRGLLRKQGFLIKLVSPSDTLQQKNAWTPSHYENFEEITINSIVTARIRKRTIVGRVMRILRNELGDNVFAEILGNDGKTYKVDYTRVKPGNFSMSPHDMQRTSANTAIVESRVVSFVDFISK
jgi:hypothetical protein